MATEAAKRAALALLEIEGWTPGDPDRVAEHIDEATGLPGLIAAAEAVLRDGMIDAGDLTKRVWPLRATPGRRLALAVRAARGDTNHEDGKCES